jgi:hypothetical protein
MVFRQVRPRLVVGLIVWAFWPGEEERPSPPKSAAEVPSEAERIYQEGLRHEKQGDLGAAQRDWEDVVRIFQGIEAENKWVQKAQDQLKELAKKSSDQRWASVRAALARARKLRDQKQRNEAAKIWDGIEERYGKDPSARAILQEMRRDRGK